MDKDNLLSNVYLYAYMSSRGNFIKHYLVKTDIQDYYLTIQNFYRYNTPQQKKEIETHDVYPDSYTYEFKIGGQRQSCADITVIRESSEASSDKKYTAVLNRVDYDTRCNTTGNMIQGYGTKHMVNTLITIISNIFPILKQIKFNDASNRSCGWSSQPNISVNLTFSYLLLNGTTWHAKYFGAFIPKTTPAQKAHAELYDFIKNKISSPIDMSYDALYILFERSQRRDISEISKKIGFEQLYSESKSYVDLFKKISSKFGSIEEYCVFISPIVDNLMRTITNNKSINLSLADWAIEINNIQKVSILNEPMLERVNPTFTGGGWRNESRVTKPYIMTFIGELYPY